MYPPATVRDLVFFYGTLMAGFDRRQRAGIDGKLTYIARGWIRAALFDLGIYPAAVPAPDGLVWGELYGAIDAATVLAALDEIEGYRPDDQDRSLYVRNRATVTLPDGRHESAWVYFYNAPLGQAQRIDSGDYLKHVKIR
ncbi:MAG: gamma-glutamylcyclotransferase [Acidobacteriota bacterium]|nr:gamma-glutamylcyclotransferase [Acidobacteriota bacterium]